MSSVTSSPARMKSVSDRAVSRRSASSSPNITTRGRTKSYPLASLQDSTDDADLQELLTLNVEGMLKQSRVNITNSLSSLVDHANNAQAQVDKDLSQFRNAAQATMQLGQSAQDFHDRFVASQLILKSREAELHTKTLELTRSAQLQQHLNVTVAQLSDELDEEKTTHELKIQELRQQLETEKDERRRSTAAWRRVQDVVKDIGGTPQPQPT
eukprot:m.95210 g.95210  ORF g.95210 m.95210 type:complete len:212 (-) comp26796_c0_seq1:71-706(-)